MPKQITITDVKWNNVRMFPEAAPGEPLRVVAEYDALDENGATVYQNSVDIPIIPEHDAVLRALLDNSMLPTIRAHEEID